MRKRLFSLLLAATLASSVLTACDGDESETAADTMAAETETAAIEHYGKVLESFED